MALDWNVRTLHTEVRQTLDGSRWMLTGSTAMHAFGMISRQPNDLNYLFDGLDGELAHALMRIAYRTQHLGFHLAHVPGPATGSETGMLLGEDPDGQLVRIVMLGGRIHRGMTKDTPAGPMAPPLVLALTKTDQFIAEPTATNARDLAELSAWTGSFDKHVAVYRDFLEATGSTQRLHDLYRAVRTVPLLDHTRFNLPDQQISALKQDYLRWGQQLATDIGVSQEDVRQHLDETALFLALGNQDETVILSRNADGDIGFDPDR